MEDYIIYIVLRYRMSQDNSQVQQTGIFDEDDHVLMSNDIGEMPEKEAPSSSRNCLIFLSIIILIIVTANHMFKNASKATPEETAQQIKRQVLQTIMEKVDSEQRAFHSNNTVSNLTSTNQSLTKLPSNSEKEEKEPLISIFPAQKQEDQHKNYHRQSKHPLPFILEESGSNSATRSQQTKLQTEKKSFQESPSQKIYPISQKMYDERIYAGEIHYSRIPVEYWEHRILMLKAMGLNTLSVYVMWNYHQIQRGKFDFVTENKNINLFLQLAVKHKMKVLLRPGPYVCAQWDFGGLPARLLGISGLKIRSFNEAFLTEVEIYFKELSKYVKPYLEAYKGPIKMVQIQNQLGSFSADPQYTKALVDLWTKYEINCQFYIQDAAASVRNNYFPGAAIGISDGSHEFDFSYVGLDEKISKDTLIFGGEIYTGWMTHWGERWGDNPMQKFRTEMEYLFQSQKQFSLYMAHGGTNFGLTAGANAGIHQLNYEPMVTSYDYNAPITEQGRKTYKSDLIVDFMKMYVRPPSISFPDPIPVIKINNIYPKLTASLIEHIQEPFLKDQNELYYFQHQKIGMYNQGIVIYQTFISSGNYSVLMTIHDFGLIFLDDDVLGQFSRIRSDEVEAKVTCEEKQCRLRILVQAMGHNNYGMNQQQDIKGLINCIISAVSNQTSTVIESRWNMYKINIDQNILTMDRVSRTPIKYPAILKQKFDLSGSVIGDTFIDMKNYSKGYVWINGRNLGRYWSRGPQFRLYCPGAWLKKENNKIVILELLSAQQETVTGQISMEDRHSK